MTQRLCAGPEDLFDLPEDEDSDGELRSRHGSSDNEDGDGHFNMVEQESDEATILYSTLKGRQALHLSFQGDDITDGYCGMQCLEPCPPQSIHSAWQW